MALTTVIPDDALQNLSFAIVQQACMDYANALSQGKTSSPHLERYNIKGRVPRLKSLPRAGNEPYDTFYVESNAKYCYWCVDYGSGYWKDMPDLDEIEIFFHSELFGVICPNIDPDWLIGKLKKEPNKLKYYREKMR